MPLLPPNTRVHLAVGYTDMRKGISVGRESGGDLTSYPALATAYWRVCADNRIEWIHGNIAFSGS